MSNPPSTSRTPIGSLKLDFFSSLDFGAACLWSIPRLGVSFRHTQQGNNNAYCQDNEISWFDWDIKERGQALVRFAKKLTRLRHQYPMLRRTGFLTGEYNEELGVKDVTWIIAKGSEMQPGDWQDGNMKCFGMLMDGRAQVTGIRGQAAGSVAPTAA